MSDQPATSSFCTLACAVIQIRPESCTGQIVIGNRRAARIASEMFVPDQSGTMSCPLTHFQEHASLKERWIADDDGRRIELTHVGSLTAIKVTVLKGGSESECDLPDDIKKRLLGYFQMDIVHNEDKYQGFECYAFLSFLTNTALACEAPPFQYLDRRPRAGDIVVFTRGNNLPDDIQHWALYLGEDTFLSKFGKRSKDGEAHVEVTNEQAMMTLYDCSRALVANRTDGAAAWKW